MKLYSWGPAPNPRRVRIFLAEKGLEVPIEEVGEGAALKQDFLAAGHRLVPELELDDGTRIGEAAAICRYFEELHPDPPLMGSTPTEKAVIEMWERKCELEGILAIGECFRNAVPFMKDRGLAGYSVPIPQIEALVERGRVRAQAFFEKLDGVLAERDFVAGDAFSIADITALCAVDFAKMARIERPESLRHLAGWYARVSERPGVKG